MIGENKMKGYRITITPLSAFGTPLVGDTLFGQICWAIVNRFGEQKLTGLLQGYQHHKPFLVVSDGFPCGYIPLPCLPSFYWKNDRDLDHKALKKKKWLSCKNLGLPLAQWQQEAKSEQEIYKQSLTQVEDQFHNIINRQTNTTGEGEFAPYSLEQIWYTPKAVLDVYIVLDENRLDLASFEQVLSDIAQFGFGRDASIGLGKFNFTIESHQWQSSENSNAYLTLANSAPQNLELDKKQCFYQITTRFGRHGDRQVFAGSPFKKPIILAKAGAIFTPYQYRQVSFIGNGLTNISINQPNAVHQGYAPVIAVNLPTLLEGQVI